MMDFRKYNTLSINGQLLKGKEILEYCAQNPIQNIQAIGDFIAEWLSENPKINIQTSGSTGKPKIIETEKEKMLQSAAATAQAFHFQKGQKALLSLPMSYIAGKMMVVRALYSQLDLICIPPSQNPILSLSPEEEIDFAPLTPMQLNGVNDSLSIKTILLGGGPVSRALEEQLQDLKAAIYHGYGMTETLSHIALRKVNGVNKSQVFQALPGVSFQTDDRDCLVIHVPFLSEPLITNDVIDLKDNTHFIWKGRADNVINSGGIKLFPESIEEKLSTQIEENFFIAGVPDSILGEKLCLFIESSPYSTEQNERLHAFIDKVLSKYEKPKQFFFCPNFIYTESGKIKRKESVGTVL